MDPQLRKLTEEEIAGYQNNAQNGLCFVCAIVEGTNRHMPHMIYEDDDAMVFLALGQHMYGWTLVCPKAHREEAVGDFTEDEYLKLQRLIYAVGKAVTKTVPTDRLYILTLGSQQANAHVHWHITALPPGVPYMKQEREALSYENGIFEMTDAETLELTQKIASNLDYSP